MARSRYEYSTSPRKLEPEYKPQQKQNKKRKLHVVEDLPRQGIKISTEQKTIILLPGLTLVSPDIPAGL